MTDLRPLLLARLVVARFGERDMLNWWATDGVLGRDGAFVGPRVLPKTHPTARARIAFEVARHACDHRHPDPAVYHLFRLSPKIEDALDRLVLDRIGEQEWWADVIGQVEGYRVEDGLGRTLKEADLVAPEDIAAAERARLGPAGRSIPMGRAGDLLGAVRLLAAGFVRSRRGELSVPFVQSVVDE